MCLKCLDGICVACLSSGRRLERLAGAARQYLHEIVDEAVSEWRDERARVSGAGPGEGEGEGEGAGAVCWECAGAVRAALRLRQRAAAANTALLQLQKYLLEIDPQNQNVLQTTCKYTEQLQSLSQLSCHTNTDVLHMTYKEYTQEEAQNDNWSSTCIKQENDDGMEQIEGCYVEEMEQAEGDSVQDKDHKAVLTSDLFNYATKTEHHILIKNNSKQKEDSEEFDESDNEPLTLKKSKQQNRKARGRRKLLDDGGDGPRVRGRGRGRGRGGGRGRGRGGREQAAGVVVSARVAARLQRLAVPPGQVEMVVLSWEEVERERARALSREQYTRHAHRCELCALGFNQRSKLDDHMRKHDPARGPLECSACHIRCRSAHALAAHRRRHRVRWRCVPCGALWSRAAVAADHSAREHRAARPEHRCPSCPHVAPTLSKLRTHLKEHGVRARCELCGKSLRDRASLKTHLMIHRGVKEHLCPAPGCGKRFVFKKAMQLHATTHLQHQHLYCHQCDTTFKNQTTFYHHMKYNLKHVHPDSLKHACSSCGRRFLSARRLADHRAATHLRTHTVACPHPGCQYACSSRGGLRAHVRSVHAGERPRRDHVCHACGKAYTTRKTLEGHLRSHSGERPFRCDACGACFGYHAALYNHTRLVHHKRKLKNNSALPASDRMLNTIQQPLPADRRAPSAGRDSPPANPATPTHPPHPARTQPGGIEGAGLNERPDSTTLNDDGTTWTVAISQTNMS